MDTSRRHPKARTVALVGRNGVGKTSLLEAMVVATKGLERPGRVEDGTALGGRDPEEKKHQMSLGIAMAPVWVGDDKLTLLDTPGFIDFYGDVERALDVADVALLVVSAVDGVQADTAVLWQLCRDEQVPVVVFINQLDAERADFEGTLSALEKLIGPTLAPLELPIGLGRGVQRRRGPAGRRGHRLRRGRVPARAGARANSPTWRGACATACSRPSWSATTP